VLCHSSLGKRLGSDIHELSNHIVQRVVVLMESPGRPLPERHCLLQGTFQPLCFRDLRGAKSLKNPRSTRSFAYAAPQQATTPSQNGSSVYGVVYEVYKGKSAVQFKPIKATLGPSANGQTMVKKKGALLLELANAYGQRQYSWDQKVTFALSVTEMSQLFLTGSILQNGRVELMHDPSMRSGAQGQVSSCRAGHV
jgi:Whirly transcription factor